MKIFITLLLLATSAACSDLNDSPDGAQSSAPLPPSPSPVPSASPDPEPSAPTFAQVSSEVLMQYCIGCHQGEMAADGVDFSTYSSFISASAVLGNENAEENLVPVVTPSLPEQSLLWQTIKSGRMPLGPQPLPENLKNLVREWIASGAKP